MRTSSRFRSAPLALAAAAAIGLPLSMVAQTGKTAPPVRTQKTAAPTTSADPGWPRSYAVSGGTAVIYQPQVASWENQTRLVAWSAVSYPAPGGKPPHVGIIKIEANTRVSMDERLVSFSDFAITESGFPSLPPEQARAAVAALQQTVPDGERVIALDRVIAAVNRSQIRPADTAGVKSDPPKIFVSTTPAVLVSLDGPPVWSRIPESDLQYALNTNWDLFEDGTTHALYLRHDTLWLTAASLEGAWTGTDRLPESLARLPENDENWKEVRANLPGKKKSKTPVKSPKVYVTTEPAELLLLNGAPVVEPVAGTSLFWVANTDSDLFRLGRAGDFYYLVAGRWFTAPAFTGPWTFATPKLPADFQKIPLEHPRSHVLASVPGTDEANEAVLLASLPQTARVNRTGVEAPEVAYQGEPQFRTIEGTAVERAINTGRDVLKVGDAYYLCFQALWFVAKNPNGPWDVAATVPTEIYAIPSSSPSYPVTHVTVQPATASDESITFAYTAGYTGAVIAWGCVVWGTGWSYAPYIDRSGARPIYYGYARTYGLSAWYNPWTSAFGRGPASYGPYGGAGAGAVYNARTSNYARGAAAYGEYPGRAVAQAWTPRTGAATAARQGSSIYGNWGTGPVQRGDDWARSAYAASARGSSATRAASSAAKNSSSGTRNTTVGSVDIYAGSDGYAYRPVFDGWERWGIGGWQPTGSSGRGSTPGTINGLDEARRSRQSGSARAAGASAYRSSPSVSSANSYKGAVRSHQ